MHNSQRYSTVLCMIAAIGLLAGGAGAQSLSIVIDDGTDQMNGCQVFEFTPFVQMHGWILATPAPGDGIRGAEFMVQLPPNVIPVSVIPSPAVTASGGSPFSGPLGGGAWVLFDECQTRGTNETVVLFEFTLLSTGASGFLQLPIVKSTQPTNPTFDCPVALNCASQWQCAPQSYRAYVDEASNPFPADQAVAVPTDADLSWDVGTWINCGCLGLPTIVVSFGTQPDPPDVAGGEPFETLDPGPLTPGTTYYWRIFKYWCGAESTSPVWSFTTSPTVAVEQETWSRVKGLYR